MSGEHHEIQVVDDEQIDAEFERQHDALIGKLIRQLGKSPRNVAVAALATAAATYVSAAWVENGGYSCGECELSAENELLSYLSRHVGQIAGVLLRTLKMTQERAALGPAHANSLSRAAMALFVEGARDVTFAKIEERARQLDAAAEVRRAQRRAARGERDPKASA